MPQFCLYNQAIVNLRGWGSPSSSTAPQAHTHRESSNRDNVQLTVTTAVSYSFELSLGTLPRHFHSILMLHNHVTLLQPQFQPVCRLQIIFIATVWFTQIYICNDTAVTISCFLSVPLQNHPQLLYILHRFPLPCSHCLNKLLLKSECYMRNNKCKYWLTLVIRDQLLSL